MLIKTLEACKDPVIDKIKKILHSQQTKIQLNEKTIMYKKKYYRNSLLSIPISIFISLAIPINRRSRIIILKIIPRIEKGEGSKIFFPTK